MKRLLTQVFGRSNAVGQRGMVRTISMLVFALVVTGCHPQQVPPAVSTTGNEASNDSKEPTPTGVSGLNHSAYGIVSFSITDAEGRGGGGWSLLPAESASKPTGGGAESCCMVVPAKWHEGMTVTVQWERDRHPYDHNNRSGDQWLKAVVKVPPYKTVTHGFWVRFLPDDRVSVQVNDQDLYIPNPVENAEAYVVQGVLDDQANAKMQANRERDKQAAAEFRQQLQDEEAKARAQGERK